MERFSIFHVNSFDIQIFNFIYISLLTGDRLLTGVEKTLRHYSNWIPNINCTAGKVFWKDKGELLANQLISHFTETYSSLIIKLSIRVIVVLDGYFHFNFDQIEQIERFFCWLSVCFVKQRILLRQILMHEKEVFRYGFICSNSPVLTGRLPFSEGSSRLPVYSWYLPFWDDPGLNVRCLWNFQVDHSFYKLGACIALDCHLHHGH